MGRRWNLHSMAEAVKRASVHLAERDGKDPYAPLNGSPDRQIWQAYAYEVERHMIIAEDRDEVLREMEAEVTIDIDS